MSRTNTLQDEGAKLITCIVPAGDGMKLAELVYEVYGLTGTNVAPGRGASQRSGTIADEIDLVTVTVGASDAEAVFAFIYDAIEIDTTPHRFMFQTALDMASIYTLPEILPPEVQ